MKKPIDPKAELTASEQFANSVLEIAKEHRKTKRHLKRLEQKAALSLVYAILDATTAYQESQDNEGVE